MARADWLLLAGLSLPWGCSFLLFKLLVAEWPPMPAALGRIAVGAAVLGVVLAATGARPLRYRAHWRAFAALGLLNNAIPFTLFSWAVTRVPSGTAAIINAMSPVFAVLVLRALGGPALAWHKLAGAAVGVAGVAVLVGPGKAAGADLLGSLACLGAALSYAVGAPLVARLRAVPSAVVATAQLWAAAALMLPPVLLHDRPWSLPGLSGQAWAALLGLGLFSTALGNLMFFRLAARAGPANAMLVTFLIPVTALLAGNLVLDEPITGGAVLGTVIIIGGLALLDGRWLPPRRGGPA